MTQPAAWQYDAAAEAINKIGYTVEAEIDAADSAYDDRPTVRFTLQKGIERVPPRVLMVLADHDLGVVDVTPQGGFLTVVAA